MDRLHSSDVDSIVVSLIETKFSSAEEADRAIAAIAEINCIDDEDVLNIRNQVIASYRLRDFSLVSLSSTWDGEEGVFLLRWKNGLSTRTAIKGDVEQVIRSLRNLASYLAKREKEFKETIDGGEES